MGHINGMAVVFQRCRRIGMTDQPAERHEDVRAFRLAGLWRTESMQQRSQRRIGFRRKCLRRRLGVYRGVDGNPTICREES